MNPGEALIEHLEAARNIAETIGRYEPDQQLEILSCVHRLLIDARTEKLDTLRIEVQQTDQYLKKLMTLTGQ